MVRTGAGGGAGDVDAMQPFLGKDGWGREVVDNNEYEGDFKDGLPHGRGKKKWGSGDSYGEDARVRLATPAEPLPLREGHAPRADSGGLSPRPGRRAHARTPCRAQQRPGSVVPARPRELSARGDVAPAHARHAADGEWHSGARHGAGTATYTGGATYKGSFKDGVFHGKGRFTWADGTYYEGEWKNGLEEVRTRPALRRGAARRPLRVLVLSLNALRSMRRARATSCGRTGSRTTASGAEVCVPVLAHGRCCSAAARCSFGHPPCG